MTKSIQHTFFYQHPPKDVWEYLTNSELIAQWLMPNNFEPILGYDFQFKINPMPKFDFDGNIYCKVVEIAPFKKLSYSWKGGPGERKITLDSIVVWTLTPKDNGTELKLVHSGFKEIENLNMYSIMDDGWLRNIKKIDNLLNTRIDGANNV
ncbi:MAG: SRPBCC domain-containing protein [Ginsengibacter sp.]